MRDKVKINIIFIVETSDHDGSCDGKECTYNSCLYTQNFYVKNKHIIRGKNQRIIGLKNPEKYLPLPKINEGDTHDCHLSYDCDDNDLDRHDYKIMIKEINKIL